MFTSHHKYCYEHMIPSADQDCYELQLSHRDNLGNQEALGRGSVQYLSAGTGVVHSVRSRCLSLSGPGAFPMYSPPSTCSLTANPARVVPQLAAEQLNV